MKVSGPCTALNTFFSTFRKNAMSPSSGCTNLTQVGAEVIRNRKFFDYVRTLQGFEPVRAIGPNQIQFP